MSQKQPLYYVEMNSPLGPLTIARTVKGVCMIQFGHSDDVLETMQTALERRGLNVYFEEHLSSLERVIKQLAEYFQGDRQQFNLPLDLYGTSFQIKVWKALQTIRYGETTSYKEIAAVIGSPKAVRAIGMANNQNPVPIIIPCHRVIGSNGALVGYRGGLKNKEKLLALEGALRKIL